MTPEELAVKLAEVDARSKSNTHRLDAVEKNFDALHELATSVKVMAGELKRQGGAVEEIKTDVTALGSKVDGIEKKPGRQWEKLAFEVLKWAVLLLLGFAAAKMGIV